jgi:GDP-L-fucose synthase
MNITDKRILVTGSGGFLGSHLVEKLTAHGCKNLTLVRSKEWDLTKDDRARELFDKAKPEVVFHLAGLVGGIAANKAHPAQFFYNNLMMGVNTLHHAHRVGAKIAVSAGAGCGYPEHAPLPLKETDLWSGFPQIESAPYSLAKRMLHVQQIAYWAEHRFNSVVTIPGNIYGPFDNFDLEGAHVVPALVRKFVEAAENKASSVEVWGSGKPTRDFVYAGDVAEGMILAAEKCAEPTLINLSSGGETSIRELVETLVDVTGYKGELRWNTSRPDGQSRRMFDVSKAKKELGWHARTSLREGLAKTVDWYRANQASARNEMLYPGQAR